MYSIDDSIDRFLTNLESATRRCGRYDIRLVDPPTFADVGVLVAFQQDLEAISDSFAGHCAQLRERIVDVNEARDLDRRRQEKAS